ncbi:pyridoxal 5'-phosphate synthase [Streptomyces sp. NPDC006475]|uniref:Pyridoxal 5'-phosphate synthase n=1 Tax=Streptomyces achmelvichensis TaxID=3134111 RepID=A0ACC6PNU2_9ACTN|nr:pyridoxal 5'-phosphate synthase [Streptomyces sp. NBC_01167]
MSESERTGSVREWLRGLEVFAGPLPEFDPANAPGEPVELFLWWLAEAVEAGVPEPHAMTLSTVDALGEPNARMLILKNVDAVEGWQFAAHAESPKGRQLADRPSVALTFYWPGQGRQVRVRGAVAPESADRSAADYLARSDTARAEALLGCQSRHLSSLEERDLAVKESLARIEREPGLVAESWTLYTLVPTEIEFWQADASRIHTRVRYERDEPDSIWQQHLLWP